MFIVTILATFLSLKSFISNPICFIVVGSPIFGKFEKDVITIPNEVNHYAILSYISTKPVLIVCKCT